MRPTARVPLALALLLLAGPALAQGLPGLGGEAAAGGGEAPGLLARIYAWINLQQGLLRRDLAELLGALKAGEPGALWGLLGGSFLYGVLHAAGPGHGKLVISGYLFASRRQLGAGLWLTLVSSLLQAVAALLLVGGFALLLGQARLTVTRNVYLLELVSYALIVAIGLVLLWRALRGPRDEHEHAHGHDHHHGHDHGPAGSGHAHRHGWTPPPAGIPRRDFWSLALSVGIRPCSGAVIVLLFTLGQGLFLAGAAATFAMAAGTALTVGLLATLAVGARGLAERLAGGRRHWVGRLAAVAGALLIVVLGALLLWSTWAEPPPL